MTNRIIFLLSALFIVDGLRAQAPADPVADSLRKVIANAPADTTKAMAYCALCLRSIGAFTEAQQEGEAGLALANALKFPKAIANCNYEVGVVYAMLGDLQKSLERFDASYAVSIDNNIIWITPPRPR